MNCWKKGWKLCNLKCKTNIKLNIVLQLYEFNNAKVEFWMPLVNDIECILLIEFITCQNILLYSCWEL